MADSTRPIVQRGSRVQLHLEIRLEDGTEALSTFGAEPLDLSLGDGTLTAGLEQLLIGLVAGADEHFLAHGDDLYGPRVAGNLHWLAREAFPAGLHPEPGQVVAFETPGGQETAGTVRVVEPNRIQVDFNHPLSGRSLQLHVLVLRIDGPEHPRENP